ncbi:MAG: helix-turn-helix transcriptional regulator [Actinobacteria bacterium]|nr:helix-turn-helix transcriptional regulator [Actinomycetota bacterium]
MGRRTSREDQSGYAQRFAKALGRTIKVMRTDQGVGRRELAEQAGISYSYLTEIENGNKPPSPSVLGPLAEALGMRMSELTQAAESRMEPQGDMQLLASPEQEWVRRFASKSPAPEEPLGQYVDTELALRASGRTPESAIVELERLLRHMAPDDIERLLDYARRLAR